MSTCQKTAKGVCVYDAICFYSPPVFYVAVFAAHFDLLSPACNGNCAAAVSYPGAAADAAMPAGGFLSKFLTVNTAMAEKTPSDLNVFSMKATG